jgi:hypothetical protein
VGKKRHIIIISIHRVRIKQGIGGTVGGYSPTALMQRLHRLLFKRRIVAHIRLQ